MSRNPHIEAIHEARYDLETCAPGETAQAKGKLEKLLLEAIQLSRSKVTPAELLDALFDDYKAFRKGKRIQQWPKL